MPTKAAYLEIDEDTEVEFEFFLAEKLHRTVAELDEMDNAEFVKWAAYFARKAQMRELAAKQGR